MTRRARLLGLAPVMLATSALSQASLALASRLATLSE